MRLLLAVSVASVFLLIVVWNPANLTPILWFQAFAMQWAAVLCLLSLAVIAVRRPAGFVGLATSIAVLLIIAMPYSSFGPVEPEADSSTFRVATANLLMTNRRGGAVARALRSVGADVLVLHEYTRGMHARIHASLAAEYGESVVAFGEDAYGFGVYAREPVEGEQVILGEHPAVKVLLREYGLTLWAVHPTAPMSPTLVHRQVEHLGAVAKAVAEGGGRRIIAGDFNAVPWNREMRRLKRVAGLVHAVPSGFRLPKPTYPSPLPVVPIDHVLVDEGTRTLDRNTFRIPGSDHIGVFVDIQF